MVYVCTGMCKGAKPTPLAHFADARLQIKPPLLIPLLQGLVLHGTFSLSSTFLQQILEEHVVSVKEEKNSVNIQLG